MNETYQGHIARLRELGFPKAAVEEVARAAKRHLFDIEPPPDLVARTIERCRAIRPRAVPQPVPETWPGVFPPPMPVAPSTAGVFADMTTGYLRLTSVMADQALTEDDRARVAAFARCESLPTHCMATIDFARNRHEPPLVLVDNHNVVNPEWWDFDSGFSGMRDSFRMVNKMAVSSGAPPTTVVMVLRPDAAHYSDEEMLALGRTIKTATSDICMVPYQSAGLYRDQDILIGGEDWVFKLEGKQASPSQAFRAFRHQGPEAAFALRNDIASVASQAFSVRTGGSLVDPSTDLGTPGGVRALIRNVIAGS
jgi:hypothetical protein